MLPSLRRLPCRGKFDIDWLNWIIVGGESGPGARPFQLEWARDTIRQCKAADVAVFVKQLGSRPVSDRGNEDLGRWRTQARKDSKGGNWDLWPADLRVRQFPKTTALPESRNPTAAGRTKV